MTSNGGSGRTSASGMLADEHPVTVDVRSLVTAFALLLLLGFGAGEFSRMVLHTVDLTVVRDVASQRSAPFTAMAKALSLLGSILVIAPVAGFLCVVYHRSGRRRASMLLAISTVGAVLIFNIEKLVVARPRPPVEHLVIASHSSFPSGHATLAAAFYGALLIVLVTRPRPRTGVMRAGMKRAGVMAAASMTAGVMAAASMTGLLVLGVALSRVYLGVHYPTDVTAGALLGTAWTLSVALALGRHEASAVDTAHSGVEDCHHDGDRDTGCDQSQQRIFHRPQSSASR